MPNRIGIGRVTEQLLYSRNIRTIEQLRKTPLITLRSILGNRSEEVLNLAQGIDDREVESLREAKSISTEETFVDDVIDKEFLSTVLLNQVEQVAHRLRAGGLEGKTITLKFRYKDFTTITRSHSLNEFTNTTKTLQQAGDQVFEEWYKKYVSKIRLLGFGVSQLRAETGSGQQLLFSNQEDKKQKKIDEVLDKIRNKYGEDGLRRG